MASRGGVLVLLEVSEARRREKERQSAGSKGKIHSQDSLETCPNNLKSYSIARKSRRSQSPLETIFDPYLSLVDVPTAFLLS